MQKIFFISMDSLFATLFWGNVISFFFLLVYKSKNKAAAERNLLTYLIIARLCHSFYYFVAIGRNTLPDWLSVNLGNTMLFIGFYFEAQAILRVVKENTKTTNRLLRIILSLFIILFNVIEWASATGGMRISVASLCHVAVMVLPIFHMLRTRDSSPFTKSAAAIYGISLLLLLVRAWYGFHNQQWEILTTNIVQSITFLALLLQLMIALPAYVLIIKDYADEALLLMATTDSLTGATNRHAFLDAAAAVYKNNTRFCIPLSLLFIDIDHFKRVNDRYGHAFGDAVLTRLASLIDGCLRESDLSCRYGGEEFVVLLSRSDHSSAQIVSQRIMDAVRQTRFEERPEFSFTVSIGVYCGIPGQSLSAAMEAADEAMYRAKRAGRDRVVFYDSTGDSEEQSPAD